MKTPPQKTRIGVLGTANIAVRSVIPAIKSLNDQYDFIGIATRNCNTNNKRKVNETSLNLINGYENIINKDLIDAVYIPLPNGLHYEWVKKSLEKGLHVLVEKSLACNYEQTLELNNLARMNNVVLVENFQFRFHSQMDYIKDALEKKILGEIRILRSSFCFPPFPDKKNIRYQRDLGGGALLDAGAYPVKLTQIILGSDLEVTAATMNSQDDLEVDIWGGAFLKQKNGKGFSQIAFGFDNFYQCNLEIVGSKGRLYTNRIFTAGETVEPKITIETHSQKLQEIKLPPDNHFQKMLRYFYDLINGRKDKDREFLENISQSRLLQEIKQKSHER